MRYAVDYAAMNDHGLWHKGGIRLGRFTVKQPQRYCLLRITPPAHPQPLAVAWMQRAEETGLSGHWHWRQAIRRPAELRQFRHCFSGRAQWR